MRTRNIASESFVVAAIVIPFTRAVEPVASSFFGTDSIGLVSYYTTNWLKIFGYQFAAVTILSLIAAGFSMSRYLKK